MQRRADPPLNLALGLHLALEIVDLVDLDLEQDLGRPSRAQLVQLGQAARRQRGDAPPSALKRARERHVGEGRKVEAVGHAQQRGSVPCAAARRAPSHRCVNCSLRAHRAHRARRARRGRTTARLDEAP